MSLGRHTLANVAGAVVPMAVALITVPLYLKVIGTERYGALSIIWVLLNYFMFFDFGLGRAVAQRLSSIQFGLAGPEAGALVWTAAIATLIASSIGGASLWWVADWYMTSRVKMDAALAAEASLAVRWLPVVLPVILLSSILQGALQARLKFYQLNVVQSVAGVVTQLLPLAVAAAGYIQLQYLIPAVLLPRLLAGWAMAVLARRYVPIGRAQFNWVQLKRLLVYGGWISLNSIFAPLLVVLDRVLIGAVLGARYVTYYTVPYDLVTKLMILPGSLSSAIFPRLATSTDPVALADESTSLLIKTMTPVVTLAILVVEPLLDLWVGPELARYGGPVAQLILVGIWINALVIPHNARMLATKNPRDITIIYLIQLPVYVVGLWFAIRECGVVGAAAAWSMRVLVDTTMILALARSLARIAAMAFLPMAVVAMAMVAANQLEFCTEYWWISVLVLLGIAMYGARTLMALAIRPALAMVRR